MRELSPDHLPRWLSTVGGCILRPPSPELLARWEGVTVTVRADDLIRALRESTARDREWERLVRVLRAIASR